MQISSPAFPDGGLIPAKYTSDGRNFNPPLVFDQVPPETKSLALIVEDPDAPHGTFVHWALWGIPAATNQIPENCVPAKTRELENGFGQPAYGGPQPPSGIHRYYFRLYALDTLEPPPARTESFRRAIGDHVLEEASLMGRYEHGGSSEEELLAAS